MRHGFLLVDKPLGPTSHDCVGMVRKTLGERSVGHLGTLDPMADGLMLLAVGRKALKVIELFTALPKAYDATVILGKDSTTFDSEGVISEHKLFAGWEPPTDVAKLQATLTDRFVGTIDQVPPTHSALKVGGERAYRKVMKGETFEMKSRSVEITECKILFYDYPKLKLHVACGAGTYIRSLAHDIGETMKCGGYLSALTRTHVGEWSVENAKSPEEVAWGDVMPLKKVLTSFQRRELTDEEWEHIRHGRGIDGAMPMKEAPLIAWFEDLPVALLEANPKEGGGLKARKVL